MNPKRVQSSPPRTAPLAAGMARRPQVNFTASAIDAYETGLSLDALVMRHPAATFFFWASGDAMQAAGIFSGDLLTVDRSLKPVPGDTVVACVDGELVVRRLTRLRGRPWLTAADPFCPPVPLTGGVEVAVWGVVTWSHHAHRKPAE